MQLDGWWSFPDCIRLSQRPVYLPTLDLARVALPGLAWHGMRCYELVAQKGFDGGDGVLTVIMRVDCSALHCTVKHCTLEGLGLGLSLSLSFDCREDISWE